MKIIMTIGALFITITTSVTYASTLLMCSDWPEYVKDIKIISNKGKMIVAKVWKQTIYCTNPKQTWK